MTPLAPPPPLSARVLRIIGLTALVLACWLLDGVGVALIGTNVLGNVRQHQLSQALSGGTSPSRGPSSPSPLPTTKPGPRGSPVGRLQIPAISLNVTLVEGAGREELTYGPGHVLGTALPGQRGNSVLAGHRTTWGHPFANLNALKRGDSITVSTIVGQSHYVVTRSFEVSPRDAAVLQPTATNVLTLVTCTPPHFATERLVVRATLLATTPLGAVGPLPVQAIVAPATASTNMVAVASCLIAALVAFGCAVMARTRPRRWLTMGLVGALLFAVTSFNVIVVEHLPAGF